MTHDDLLELLRHSSEPAAAELVADVAAAAIQPSSSESGREGARSVASTFAIRAKTTAAAGIRTLGLESTLARLNTLAPDEPILLFHFSGLERHFTAFVREVDGEVVGVAMVDRVPGSGRESFDKANT